MINFQVKANSIKHPEFGLKPGRAKALDYNGRKALIIKQLFSSLPNAN